MSADDATVADGYALIYLGGEMADLDATWCNDINGGFGGCDDGSMPNDEVVPAFSQTAFVASTTIPVSGPNHSEETAQLTVHHRVGAHDVLQRDEQVAVSWRTWRHACVAVAAMGLAQCTEPHGSSPSGRVLWHAGVATAFPEPAYDGTAASFITAAPWIPLQRSTRKLAPSGGPSRLGIRLLRQRDDSRGASRRDVVACDDLDIVAFHRTDGSFAWRLHDPGDPGMLSMFVVGSTIYAGSFSGMVYAVDAPTGTLKWSQAVFPGDSTAALTPGDRIADTGIVVTAFTRWESSPRAGAVAFNPQTGTQLWRVFYPPPLTPRLWNRSDGEAQALWQNVVLGTGGDGTIYAS